MSADPTKVSVYCQGTFSTENPNQDQQQAMIAAAKGLAQSGFGTVLLGQWHVHADGSLYYNDSPLTTVKWAMNTIPSLLRQGVKNVPLTFGPFASDFEGIANNLTRFKATIQSLINLSEGGITGLDWDLEGDYDKYVDLLVDLTNWGTGLGLTVTAAPYQSQQTWIDVLKRTNAPGKKGFAWWNLQLYGGADYGSWVTALNGIVPSPQSFLLPGYNIDGGVTPGDVQSQIASLFQQYPSMKGAFLWRYEDMAPNGYTPAQYASAIVAGLSGQGAQRDAGAQVVTATV